MHITFTNSAVLLWLPLAWLLTAACWWIAVRSQRVLRQRYGERDLVDAYTRRESRRSISLQLSGWLAVVALLVVAIADPVTKDEPHRALPPARCE